MDAILDQLGLNNTFFIEFGIFAVTFLILGNVFFKPFMKLIEARHKKTVEDRESAEKLMAQATSKLEEYKRILAEERLAAKKGYDLALAEARKQEDELLGQARDEAKRITQEALDSVAKQRDHLKKQLEADVEVIAQTISERLLSRKM